MPACPRCQTPYEVGARFCQQCGNPLGELEPPKPGPGPAPEEPPAPPTGADAPQPASRRPPAWLLALLGAGVVILILAVIFFTRKSAPPPTSEAPAPEASLQEQVARLLGTLREAQVNKDINRLMSCYATAFPAREQKIRETIKAWQDVDFTAMFFSIEDLQPEGPEAARAKVTWDIQVKDKRTGEFITATQKFRVEFVKEQGAWRIRSLEEISAH